MFEPFLYAGLNCKTGKGILCTSNYIEAMYAASLWDTSIKLSQIYQSSQIPILLGAHYNPLPSEAMHMLIDSSPLD